MQHENGVSADHWADLDTMDSIWRAATAGVDGAWARFRERPTLYTYVALVDALDHLQVVQGRVSLIVGRIARTTRDHAEQQWQR